MSKREKLVQRFLALPRDFTWQDLVTMLEGFGYKLSAGGKSGGSRVKFLHDEYPPIILHKPHPTPVLKRYQMEQIMAVLKGEGLV
ncbi:MAG: type II toxin-antitoxin system HicA family toxin [Geobacteraceae bacterium]|nr:type II toxin-antitoxin system HicA family toxin [Geobacteraceae bacterium]